MHTPLAHSRALFSLMGASLVPVTRVELCSGERDLPPCWESPQSAAKSWPRSDLEARPGGSCFLLEPVMTRSSSPWPGLWGGCVWPRNLLSNL